jgi:hypothetical protein
MEGSMRNLFIAAMLLMLPAATLAQAPAPPALESLAFLIGEWTTVTGKPGEPSGRTEFTRALQDRVILRKNDAEVPAEAGKPSSRHEDLMVIYVVQSGAMRAEYYDNEGHVIRYIVNVPAPNQALFLSESASGEPRFRLMYRLEPTGVLRGTFDIASAGTPDEFQPYLDWESRKATEPAK